MGLRAASLFLLWLALSSANEIKKGRTRSHGHYVCSTWGNNHFKTFDGDVYQFPGTCEYNFVSDCREAYKEFSVHIQRGLDSNGHPEIQYILLKVKDIMVYLKPNLVVVDGRIVKTPYYTSGVLIESNDIYTKIYAKLGMVLMWNQQDALMVELDSKFNNHTCGLCGDYNGIQIYNEFIKGDASYNSITYGNMQKISKPNSKCEDPDETQALASCNEHRDECQRLLTSAAFADCRLRLNLEMYIQACMQDKCACNGKDDSFCLCSTISEYSRQCSHAGGRPGEWRTQSFCPKTCPATMVYKESSSPCVDTCSHLQISSLCEEHYMDGCFCPEGTMYDDISEKGCIPVSQCHCKLGGKAYAPGESISKECEECTCNSGRWTCKDLPCPGTCSVEGGSHFTTFDGKKYTFHGDCYYVLAKGTANESYALLAELAPCGSTDKQTCLKTVVLLVDNKKNVVVFRSDGSVLLNEMTVNVPHVSTSFSVFKPSSNYFVVQTPFGLQMQIQLFKVMQLFVTVDESVKGKLQGLCGNFNGMEGDDFRTTSGLIEATGSAFANTWKAQSTCTDQAEKLEDPCSLSIESANYAEHWCSLLRNPKGPFARCHIAIDPSEYYKKCKYDTCLCEDNEECLCAALSSYSRACAFKGIILGDWRNSVCSSEASSCPGNQVFLYNLTMCQQTCRSLADGEKYCLQDFAPVDGCGCPPNTYLDNQDNCVAISQCPCYYKGSYLEPGQYFTKDGERCVCRNAKIQCTSVKIRMKSENECSSSKRYFDCNAFSKWTSQTPLQLSCHTPQTDHFQTECVSGCVCPEGLYDDGRGGCVEQKDCPCIHNNEWYSSGDKIKVDCNTCTCQKGVWKCTDDVCYGTCMIYGSGHYNTFDGKFYDFDGSCEYVATQDFCGDKNSSGSFSIITENVPCGTTGVTCSKAIKMFLGKTELKLENKEYKEIQRDVGDDVQYWNRTVGLYLVIEASNGVMLIWDKKTTVFIKLSPDYKGKVCGLCGNFDDKANNDFTTRSGLQDNNPLNFGNSWKQSPMCPDVTEEIKPCDLKPHRKSWAEKECSIIQSEVFKICHSKVDPLPYYEACVHDACSCDSGGDCECFCSAVAAYAQECIKAEACVFWRTPDICPIFCDYYNPRNECDWHYEPCGSNITTCRMINNVSTNFTVPLLEGCYPRCPKDKPIYNEETKQCVTEDQCGCYLEDGTHILPDQEVPTKENCTICVCDPSGSIQCKPLPGCPCIINGTSYEEGATVGHVQDGEICITYICAANGSVVPGEVYPCPTSSPTTISTSSPHSTLTTTTTVSTTSHPVTTTPCILTELICDWTEWFDVSKPEEGGGDYETYDEIRKHGNKICTAPEKIECRAKDKPDVSLEELGQKVECNVKYGLICKNDEQDVTMWPLCYNYEIRVNCCEWQEVPCGPTVTPTIPSTATTTQTTISSTTTTRTTTEITTMPIHIHSTTSPTPPTPSTPKSTTTPSTPETPTTTSTPTTTTTGPPTPTSTTSSTSSPTPTYTTTTPTPGPTSSTLSTPKSTTTSTSPETPTTTTSPPSTTTTTTTVTGSTTTMSTPQTPTPPTPSTPKSTTTSTSPETPTTTTSPPSTTTTVTGPPTPTSTTSSASSPTPTYTTTTPTPVPTSSTPSTPKSTTPLTETPTSTTSPPSTTTTVTGPPTPTSTTSSASSPTPTYTTTTPTPGPTSSTLSTPKSTTTSTSLETLTTTTSPPSTTTTVPITPTTPENINTITPSVPPTEAQKTPEPEVPTTASTPVTPSVTPLPTTRTTEISTVSTASTTSQKSTSPVSTSPVTTTTSEVTETTSTPQTTTSGPTPSRSTSTTPVTETTIHETTTTRIPTPPTGFPTPTSTPGTTTTSGTSSSTGTQPPVSTTPFTGTSTPKTTTSGPTPSRSTSTTPVTETTIHETTTTRIPTPPTGFPTPTSTPSTTTTSGPSSPTVSTTPFTGTTSTPKTTTSSPTPSVSTPPTTTVGTETSTPRTTSATVTTPTTSPTSTSPVSTTTSGTTPTESFTTTSGTTSSSFITVNATTSISTTFKTLPPVSTTTSGPTATSTAVTITGSSTHSTTPPVNGSTTGLTPTTPKKTCTIFPNESYEQGDSWMLCNCTKVICIEDNIVQVIPIICNPPPKPTCANGLSPVPVMDEDGCCWHWECDCYCTGWGDPHYMTFDGLYYSYQGNCTYVLVEEINKKVDNFGVYIDNYHCDVRDVVSCPRTLVVRHETQEVRLRTAQPNTLQVEVTVNNQLVALPYKKFGVSIYESGINRVVEIPELKMNVTYNGLSFSIRMPYSLFGNNTQGQCGTCNNNTADDCMLPNGNIAENCETMADHWQVVDPSKPQCSPGLVPTSSPSTTPTQPCKESSICELLLGSVFKPCHAFVQPEKYYAACVFDSCVLPNLDLECSSLQIYAATCADQGACIDWRKHTNGVCSHECPSGKEYRACGPIKEMTCKSRGQNETSTKQVEGCFCPNGTMLYDSGVDVCVKTCGCVGVDMIPREFGEKFTVDCQDCICLEGEHGIVCEPHVCDQKKVTCDGEGFYEVTEVNPKDSCCPLFTCKCNTSLCTAKAPKCSLGFEVHSYIPSGQCCPVYQCVPKGVCVHENAEFLPNSSVFVDKCQNCICTNDVNVSTQLNIISCEHVPCNTYCQPGYELKPVKGECCGKCVQTKCIIHTADNSELILSPGDFKNDPHNNCTIYSCVDIHDQLIASTSEITCPAFNEDSCKPGTISFLPNGCCKTCAPLDSNTPCTVRHRKDFIVYNGCRSVDRVDMTECEGTCGTFSLYSAEANSMDHSCSCCRETSTTEKQVVLKCPGGHAVSHKYIYVESCSCQDTECKRPESKELQKN
ncbi:mucin-2 isoform X1 [Passer montanus]|uniref:mucin-2 isoform X1 n=1 Tax=Passer montanus TaxID=9160 RepID=UPI00195FDF64|nr:mucin-2 isoform X1 [Passer montanus]